MNRQQCIDFIISDTKSRGEDVVSDIRFFAAIYTLRVRANGKTQNVNYSAAESVLKGYRVINKKEEQK